MLELDKEYTYKTVEDFAKEEGYEIEDLGDELVGENFLVLKQEYSRDVISLILTGTMGGDYLYKVIYTD
jgi:methanogenic corrinoid protein MtbC1